MGYAIIIDSVDFSNTGMGKVTLQSQVIELQGISIASDDVYTGTSIQLDVTYTPSDTTQIGVSYSIESGSEYASITTDGLLEIKPEANQNDIVVKATSTVNPNIFTTKTINVKYVSDDLLSIATNDPDVKLILQNYNVNYQLEEEVTTTGSESSGTPVTNPVQSLDDNFFVLFDVTFGMTNSNISSPCLFCRLADNANFHKAPNQTVEYKTEWAFRSKWSSPQQYVLSDCYDGERYKVFCSFNKQTGTLFLKNFTTGHTATTTNAVGDGTIRPEVYLFGGTVSDNAFDGTIHEFIIGTYE